MTPFETVTSVAAPMGDADIDTDIIFPARFLLRTEKQGLGRFAFFDQRFDPDGRERGDFVLHRTPWRRARILVGGPNFGCGSSREQAPWALADLGLRCIIAPSFGEIFQANCIANGLLPVVLSMSDWSQVLIEAQAALPMTVDLNTCTVSLFGGRAKDALRFQLPPRQRLALLAGLDETGLISRDEGARIDAFEQRQRELTPWLYASDDQPAPLAPLVPR